MTTPLDPDLAGTFAEGYDPEDASDVFETIQEATGIQLVCGWDYFDAVGYGGDSQFYVLGEDERVYELKGGLWPWLLGDISADVGPGDPATWRGDVTTIDLDEMPVYDGTHFAFEDQE